MESIIELVKTVIYPFTITSKGIIAGEIHQVKDCETRELKCSMRYKQTSSIPLYL